MCLKLLDSSLVCFPGFIDLFCLCSLLGVHWVAGSFYLNGLAMTYFLPSSLWSWDELQYSWISGALFCQHGEEQWFVMIMFWMLSSMWIQIWEILNHAKLQFTVVKITTPTIDFVKMGALVGMGAREETRRRVTGIYYIRYEILKEYNYSTKKLLPFPTCGMCTYYPSNSCLVGLKPYFLEAIIIPMKMHQESQWTSSVVVNWLIPVDQKTQTAVLTVGDAQHHRVELCCIMKVGRSAFRVQTVRWERPMANIKYKQVTTAAMESELPVLRSKSQHPENHLNHH